MGLRRLYRPARVRRVKWKIMLPFAVLTGLFALFATKNMTELVTSSLEDRLDRQLVTAAQYASDATAKREREHLELVRTIAFTEGVAAAAQTEHARLEALILPIAANSGAHRVEIFDTSGWRVYGVTNAQDPVARQRLAGEPVPQSWSAVYAVLQGQTDARGDKWAEIVATDSGAMLMTAGPIKDETGRLTGAAVVSTPMSMVLLDIKQQAFADITISDGQGTVLSSTFDVGDAGAENGFLRGKGGTAAGMSSSGTVLGRDYQFLNSDLVVRGDRVGTTTVAASLESVATTGQTARLRMSVIFGAITIAVIAIGWAVARHLTSPLNRLVAAATAVSRGDLSARSNVRTGDEIGVLGESFDAMAEQLEQQHIATIGALASAIDARDPYTAGHSVRVGDLSAELGSNMGMPKPALHHLRVGGLLHDIGKIGVRDTILLKAGALSPEERRLIEQHPTIGLRILEGARLPAEVLEIVGGHHERLNGKGYPLGLSAEEISVFPRVTAVADMYDALTTDRPYRPGMSPQEALRILWRDAENGLLDHEVVATMRRIARLWEERRASASVQTKAWLDSLQAIRSQAA